MLNNPKSDSPPKFSPIQEGKNSDFSDLRWQFADKNWMKNPATLDFQWVAGLMGAQNRTRTCTSLNTRTWNERVYHSATWAFKYSFYFIMSGKRDSNSRPRPWQGRALPTELFPHGCCSNIFSILHSPECGCKGRAIFSNLQEIDWKKMGKTSFFLF